MPNIWRHWTNEEVATLRIDRVLNEVKEEINHWKERALEAEGKLKEHERRGGTLNLERSWKTKYRNALAEANQRLLEAGLEPVRIRKSDIEEEEEAKVVEQLSLPIGRRTPHE